MTSFHLNETVCFDQNGLFWYKTMLFRPTQKKRVPDGLSCGHCLSSSTFCTRKVA